MQGELFHSIKSGMLMLLILETLIQVLPGRKYTRYARMISGIIMTAFFLNTVVGIFGDGNVEAFKKKVEGVEVKMNESSEWMEIKDDYSEINNGKVDNVELSILKEEVKTKLNEEMHVENYVITNVEMPYLMEKSDKSYTQLENSAYVVVNCICEEETISTNSAIKVDKIKLGSTISKKENNIGEKSEDNIKYNLRYEIARILETDISNVEVILDE